jgi:hypothetical protein
MRRHLRALVMASVVMLASLGAGPAWAQTTSCQLGPIFVMLRDQVGRDRVGECTGPVVRNEAGDMTQPTTRGILTLRSTDQVVAFSDGQTTWLFGPNGLESRPSGSRLAWESAGTGRSTGGTTTGSTATLGTATPTPVSTTASPAYGSTSTASGTVASAYGTPTSASGTTAYGTTSPPYGSAASAPGSTSAAYTTPTIYPASYAANGTTTSSAGTSPAGLLTLPPGTGASPSPSTGVPVGSPGSAGLGADGMIGLSPTASPSPMVPLKDELPLSMSGSDASSSKPFTLAGGDYPVRWDVSLQHGKSGCYVGARLRRFDDQNPGALVMHTTLGSTKDRSSGGDTRLFSVAPGRYVLDVTTTGCSWKLTIQAP